MAVRVETNGPVTTVILDRPEVRNAVDGPTAQALADAFRAFEGDASSSVAVLWGANGTFCAGADLKAMARQEGTNLVRRPEVIASPNADLAPMGPTWMLLSKPVIAAVSGYAVAGGLELALWCDLRVAEKTAVFGAFERRWGVPLIDGGTVRLPRLVGLGRALDLMLTGRAVAADEALSIGLCDRVVEPGRARAAAEELAAEISAFPQTCLRNDRSSAYEQLGMTLDGALRNELERGLDTIRSGEHVAGAKRFSGGAGRGGAR